MKRVLYVTCVIAYLAYVSANTSTEGQIMATSPMNIPAGDDGGGGQQSTPNHNPLVVAKEGKHDASHESSGLERYPIVVIDFVRVQTPFIIGLWIFCACLGKIGFHLTSKLSHMFPESCMLIVLGIIIGALLFYTQAASVSPLTADVFFIYMLPPIILDAGYFMPNRLFFDNLGTILVFAVLGTIWNCFSIGISMYALSLTGLFGERIPVLHLFLFSSLISAVDPVAVLAVFEEIQVEEVLYILVFGESLLNDGVTVVLYHMFEGYSEIGEANIQAVDYASGLISFFLVALGGTLIGIIWGFLTAFVTRWTNHVRVIEPIFVFVMAYLAYLNAEIFHFSGILAITFCGITMKNYVEQNISVKSHTTIKYAMKMLASSSETIIFMFLGVATIQSNHYWNTWFVFFTILFCSVYRILGVLIFSTLCNRFRVKKIEFVDKFVMSYGGLRGAIAFALVITINSHHIPQQPMFMTATIAMVYFTVFIQGITIKPLVQMLGVKKAEKRTLTMNERLHERVMDYMMAGIEDLVGRHGNFHIRDKFKRFNNTYLTPFLVREHNVIEPKILETLGQIKMQEARDYAANSGSSPNHIESFTTLLRSAITHAPKQKKQDSTGEFNLDVGELEYNATARDINDAKYHHLLSAEYKPMKRHRASTYKRHAVRDDDIQTQTDVNHHNMYLHTRQFVSAISRQNKQNKKNKKNTENGAMKGGKAIKSSEIVYKQNGTAIKLQNDYVEDVLRDNPAFEADELDLSGLPYGYGEDSPPITFKRKSTKGPTAAETALPWKRYSDDDIPTCARKVQRQLSFPAEEDQSNAMPTMAEILLPWKRPGDEDTCDKPLKQSEFPAWASNSEYVGYNSPSNTFLGGIGIKGSYPNIRDIFARRTSSSLSLGSRRGSLKDGGSVPQSRRGSVKDNAESKHESLKESSRRSSLKESLSQSSLSSPVHQQDLPLAVRRRASTGDNSLITTVITEEDGRKGDHVIEMDPEGGSEHTRM